MEEASFTVTSAIAYGTRAPHVGQAYQYVFADATARFMRLDGYCVSFSCGMDENGAKVPLAAVGQGLTETALIDRTAEQFRELMSTLRITCDRVLRTASPEHRRTCTELWTRMSEGGDIYLADYFGWYSPRTDLFHDESQTESRADGVRVVGGSGHPVIRFDQPVHFFRLSKYRDRLHALHEGDPNFVGPEARRAEILAEMSAGLPDIPISCPSSGWGVPVPGSPGHRMHVWFDALAGYVTSARVGSSCETWPPDLQITSRGSIRFHAIHWPAFLMAADLAIPTRIYGHGFLLSAGRRLSRGNGTLPDIFELIADYGVDAVRLFMLAHGPFGEDGEFSTEALRGLANRFLVDGLGDLVERCTAWIAGHHRNRVPECGPLLEADAELLAVADGLLVTCRLAYRTQMINGAIESLVTCVSSARTYLEQQMRCACSPERVGTVLHVTVEVLRIVGILLQPAVPDVADTVLTRLGVNEDARTFAALPTRLETGASLQWTSRHVSADGYERLIKSAERGCGTTPDSG